MRILKALSLALPLSALILSGARDASACGGCFVQQSESTQVTGHKMLLSVSNTQTTLWDQIVYSGNPAEFAWVLPIKGEVDIGLSSDALFQSVDAFTQVTVSSPVIQCPPPPDCFGSSASGGFNGGDGTGGAGGGGGGVTVIAQEVVGPYETVQLTAEDPAALKNWLIEHQYQVPADVAPVIDAYVNEGFGFLALKLVPGKDVSAMRPIRVTSPGASPALPLRMVAAGTGAVTPITLWVFGEGRYEPTNMPEFIIEAPELVWNWDTSSSNYAALKQSKFDSTQGKGWLVEAAEPISKYYVQDSIDYLVQYEPDQSGYTAEMNMTIEEAAQDDLFDLFGTIDETSLWITRLHGELSRKALAADLALGASNDQTPIARYLEATQTTGTQPACPEFPPCSNGVGSGSSSGGDDDGGWGFIGGVDEDAKIGGGKGGCAMMGPTGTSAAMSTLVAAASLALLRARRRRRSL